MCNLYNLAPWEVRNLIRHYTLIGSDFNGLRPPLQACFDQSPQSDRSAD
jgi:hypothetical protein